MMNRSVAVGISTRINGNVVVKSSVGTDTQHEAGYNVGVLSTGN
ncbi:hypothetical protein HCX07_16330 [Escherichia coli]|nr:hypothetical protein [Salmonella enterica]NJW03641.1 hypothetical protein [Escherichia coli]